MIDLSVGSPDMSPPSYVVDTLVKYSKDRTKYGYTLKGIDEFNQAVQYFYKHRYHVEINSEDEVLQLMGSQDGLSHLATAIIDFLVIMYLFRIQVTPSMNIVSPLLVGSFILCRYWNKMDSYRN